MFRDKDEELQRLNEDLLAQEEPEQTEVLDEEALDALLEDETEIGEAEEGYSNYSNGYRAYNTDKTDTDLDSFSEAVREPAKDRSLTFLSVLALVLTGAIVLVLGFLLLKFRGLL